jgi:hypothetical protein
METIWVMLLMGIYIGVVNKISLVNNYFKIISYLIFSILIYILGFGLLGAGEFLWGIMLIEVCFIVFKKREEKHSNTKREESE